MAQTAQNLPAVQPPQPLAQTNETASVVLAAQAKALVSARFEIAMRQPRDLESVRQRLMRECARPSFCAVAIYSKPVGPQNIKNPKKLQGPSIRFAEACLQAMGNLAIDTPAIYDDPDKRILRVSVSDMETNVTHSKDVTVHKVVERRQVQDGDEVIRTRKNSYGDTLYIRRATDDEILNQENALVSKALRTTGLRLVPGWLIDECLAEVRATQKTADAQDPDAARRKLYDAFEEVGVSVKQIVEWLGHSGNLQPAELEELRGIYTAIRDGETTWREVLDAKWQETVGGMDANAAAAATGTRTQSVKEKLAQKTGKPAGAKPTPAQADEALRRQLDAEAEAQGVGEEPGSEG